MSYNNNNTSTNNNNNRNTYQSSSNRGGSSSTNNMNQQSIPPPSANIPPPRQVTMPYYPPPSIQPPQQQPQQYNSRPQNQQPQNQQQQQFNNQPPPPQNQQQQYYYSQSIPAPSPDPMLTTPDRQGTSLLVKQPSVPFQQQQPQSNNSYMTPTTTTTSSSNSAAVGGRFIPPPPPSYGNNYNYNNNNPNMYNNNTNNSNNNFSIDGDPSSSLVVPPPSQPPSSYDSAATMTTSSSMDPFALPQTITDNNNDPSTNYSEQQQFLDQQQQQPPPQQQQQPPLPNSNTNTTNATKPSSLFSSTTKSICQVCDLFLSFRHLRFMEILSGLLCGILMSAFSAAFSSAIFDEVDLDQYIGIGYGVQSMGLVVSGALHCIFAQVGGTMVSPDINPTIFLASMSQIILSQSPMNGTSGDPMYPDTVVATILASIILATVGLGIIMYLLGSMGLTRVLQMLPFPVLAGFMASVGYTICDKAFMLSLPPDIWKSGPFGTNAEVLDWWRLVCPAVLFGFALLLHMRSTKSSAFGGHHDHHDNSSSSSSSRLSALIMPTLLLLPLGIFFIVILGVSSGKADLLASARKEKWLIQRIVLSEQPSAQFQMSYGAAYLVDWAAVQSTVPTMFLLWVVTSLDALLKLAGLRRFLQVSEMNIDHEMMLAGKSIFLSGFLVGAPSYAQPPLTQINTSIIRDYDSRRASFIAIALNFALYMSGFQIANYLPRFWLSGILFASGMNFLLENLWDSRHKMNRVEYAIIWLIVLVNAISSLGWSILTGVVMSGWIFALAYGRQGSVKRVLVGSTTHSVRFRSPSEKLRLNHLGKKILVLELQKFIFFGSAAWIRELVLSFAMEQKKSLGKHSRAKYYIIDWADVEDMDYTAVNILLETMNELQKLGDDENSAIDPRIISTTATSTGSVSDYISIIFTGLKPALTKKLLDTDVITKLYAVRWRASVMEGMEHTIPLNERRTFSTLDIGLEWAEDRILERAAVVRSRWGISIESFRTLHHQALVYAKNEEEENVFGSRLGGKVFPYQKILTLKQGDVVHREDDVDESAYIIQRGKIDTWVTGSRVAALGRGNLLNEAILYDSTHTCQTTAVVTSEVAEIFAISRTAMEQLELDDAFTAAELHRFFAKYATLLREQIEDSLSSVDYLMLATVTLEGKRLKKSDLKRYQHHHNMIKPSVDGGGANSSSTSTGMGEEEEQHHSLQVEHDPSTTPAASAATTSSSSMEIDLITIEPKTIGCCGRCCLCCRRTFRTPIEFVRGSLILAGFVTEEEQAFSLLDSGVMSSSLHVGAIIAQMIHSKALKVGRVSLDEWCDRYDRLNQDVENDWYRLSRGASLITSADVCRVLQVPRAIADEMIWEADVDSTGGVSLLDLVEALATVASSELISR
jgi:SulP family sulfate permease